jgi:DNA-binding NtrC family response regulator
VSTILFVDDHHAFRTVFAEILRVAGHSVLEAGTVADAQHLIERHSGAIEFLIAEAVLTTGNGLEITQRLKHAHFHARVLFISEESAIALRKEKLLPAGAPFLQKPFAAEDLMRKLQQLAKPTTKPAKKTLRHAR